MMDGADDNDSLPPPDGRVYYGFTTPPSQTSSAAAFATATCRRGRATVAKGVQKTLSKTSMLVNFLPTGTLLSFELLLPSVSGAGSCSPARTTMMHALLALCAASCFFFHFTDSFRGPDGRVYYGFVTPGGLALFKTGLGVEVPRDDRYRVGFVDLVHAAMAVAVFAAIALSGTAGGGSPFGSGGVCYVTG